MKRQDWMSNLELAEPRDSDGSLLRRFQAGSDQAVIQGTWEFVATLQDGKQVQRYVGVQAIMRGNMLTWIFPQPGGKPQVQKAVFRLDPSKNPKHFDWHPAGRPREVHRRLYVLAGDTLLWSTGLGTGRRGGLDQGARVKLRHHHQLLELGMLFRAQERGVERVEHVGRLREVLADVGLDGGVEGAVRGQHMLVEFLGVD